MQDNIFLDSNIILYCYSNDETDKQAIARNIFEQYSTPCISKQVINEVSNILFRKFKLDCESIENAILQISNLVEILDFNLTTQIKAIRLKKSYNLQYFDALIVATALENNCNTLYSEDMQNGLVVEGKLTIINPFEKLND
ncbi:MAG: PIN domain-containing protein [Arcobacteraceae bacterium]|uniref:DNA-binding protein n=1 Tax=Aliarcobacter cryaerophilus TaxID=28198 RepID=A0A2S9T6P9_9BACT|nr:PIN domain-containing protein [Aliarcobacter cryaerophilus]PRM94469.1 DNA-binding protein [Aliarcobacter cryaerophilus]